MIMPSLCFEACRVTSAADAVVAFHKPYEPDFPRAASARPRTPRAPLPSHSRSMFT